MIDVKQILQLDVNDDGYFLEFLIFPPMVSCAAQFANAVSHGWEECNARTLMEAKFAVRGGA